MGFLTDPQEEVHGFLLRESMFKDIGEGGEGEEQGVISTLALGQVIAHLARRGKGEAIKLFIDYVRETGMIVIETTFLDFVEAVTEMDELNLDYKIWKDLIISCQMKRTGVQEIYTNDKDFEKIKWIKPISP